jgi:hypothetical protein
MLQQHNGFAIRDIARTDCRQCAGKIHLNHFNILSLFDHAAAVSGAFAVIIFSNNKVQFLADRAGAHPRREYFLHLFQPIAGLFFCFVTNALFRLKLVQQGRLL